MRGDYLFVESGLDNVTLRGVELLKCDKCGTVAPILPKLNQLMRVIASALVLKPSELAGNEIRFLRKYAGLTGEQFGKKLGLSKEHVSRIENEKYPVGPQTDRLIRYVALSTDPNLQHEVKQLFERLDEIKKENRNRSVSTSIPRQALSSTRLLKR